MKTILKILLIAILFSFTGCKSKKKVVEKEQEKVETVTQTQTATEIKEVASIDSVAVKETETIKIESTKDIELEQADPDKTIILEDSSGKVLKVTGANVKITESEKTETVETIDSTSLQKEAVSDLEVVESETIKEVRETKKVSKWKDLKSFFGGWWIILIIVLILLAIYYIIRKRLKFPFF